jgi:hypothetical protein
MCVHTNQSALYKRSDAGMVEAGEKMARDKFVIVGLLQQRPAAGAGAARGRFDAAGPHFVDALSPIVGM